MARTLYLQCQILRINNEAWSSMKQKKKKPLNCIVFGNKFGEQQTKQTNKQTKDPSHEVWLWSVPLTFFLLFHGSNTVAQMIWLLAVKRLDRFRRYAVLAFLLFSVRLNDKSICCSYAIVTEICADLRAKIKKERKKRNSGLFCYLFQDAEAKICIPNRREGRLVTTLL